MAEPTNTQLLEVINKHHAEDIDFKARIETRLTSVEAQVRKTNGQVTRNKESIAEIYTSERVRKELKAEQATIKKAEKLTVAPSPWNDPKLVGLVMTVLSALAGYLVYLSSIGA